MLGCTGNFEESQIPKGTTSNAPGTFPEDEAPEDLAAGPRAIYLHGSSTARMFKLLADRETPVCIAATTMQGVVLALTPFHNSCNYASAVAHGYASLVTSEAERLYALTRITDDLIPHRWDNSRNPPTKAEMTSTSVLKVNIVSASAKIRVGGPSDDRNDLKDPNVVGKIWTGIVPTWTQYGEPVASSYNEVQKVPSYIRTWIKEENQKGEKAAALATIAQAKK
jgi:nitroimidazol reductase NimA-like FMN-containing flavoprotein (pyridoxamine 5'-phosphate oxidase superfamily)